MSMSEQIADDIGTGIATLIGQFVGLLFVETFKSVANDIFGPSKPKDPKVESGDLDMGYYIHDGERHYETKELEPVDTCETI